MSPSHAKPSGMGFQMAVDAALAAADARGQQFWDAPREEQLAVLFRDAQSFQNSPRAYAYQPEPLEQPMGAPTPTSASPRPPTAQYQPMQQPTAGNWRHQPVTYGEPRDQGAVPPGPPGQPAGAAPSGHLAAPPSPTVTNPAFLWVRVCCALGPTAASPAHPCLLQTGELAVRKPVRAAGEEYKAIITAQDKLAEERERQEKEMRRQQAEQHRAELDRLVYGAWARAWAAALPGAVPTHQSSNAPPTRSQRGSRSGSRRSCGRGRTRSGWSPRRGRRRSRLGASARNRWSMSSRCETRPRNSPSASSSSSSSASRCVLGSNLGFAGRSLRGFRRAVGAHGEPNVPRNAGEAGAGAGGARPPDEGALAPGGPRLSGARDPSPLGLDRGKPPAGAWLG